MIASAIKIIVEAKSTQYKILRRSELGSLSGLSRASWTLEIKITKRMKNSNF